MRAHDSIEEKRWRARVAANEARRRLAVPTDPFDDDKDSALRDEWRAEEREWREDVQERYYR